MARRIRLSRVRRKKQEREGLTFTVIYLPLDKPNGSGASARTEGRSAAAPKNPEPNAGYQVTVPLLPGLVTYGRTLEEAKQMARDAIECHIEGLRKSGESIPNERLALKGKLRVALSA